MTNEQIVEALATEVMGWHKALGADGYIWWLDKKDSQKVRENDFMPLVAHSQMAIVRKKMRADGWSYKNTGHGRAGSFASHCNSRYQKSRMFPGRGAGIDWVTGRGYSTCELMAEALAIIEAVRKEGGE